MHLPPHGVNRKLVSFSSLSKTVLVGFRMVFILFTSSNKDIILLGDLCPYIFSLSIHYRFVKSETCLTQDEQGVFGGQVLFSGVLDAATRLAMMLAVE